MSPVGDEILPNPCVGRHVYPSEEGLTELAANFRNFGKSHPVPAR
jgi:hypothetical protein